VTGYHLALIVICVAALTVGLVMQVQKRRDEERIGREAERDRRDRHARAVRRELLRDPRYAAMRLVAYEAEVAGLLAVLDEHADADDSEPDPAAS